MVIKENRIKMNLTQEELAEKLEISTRQLQRIEKNEEATRISTLKRIIKILNIPDNDIINFLKTKNEDK